MRKRSIQIAILLVGATTAVLPVAAQPVYCGEGQLLLAPSQLEWKDAPAVAPGAKIAVIEGPLDKAVLVSGALAAETTMKLIPLGTHELRGIASPCAVFTVADN